MTLITICVVGLLLGALLALLNYGAIEHATDLNRGHQMRREPEVAIPEFLYVLEFAGLTVFVASVGGILYQFAHAILA